MLSPITSSLREAFARLKPLNIGGLGEMLRQNWHLGFTAFGGPAVHFQIVSTHGSGYDQDLSTLAYLTANASDSFINCSWINWSGWMNRWYDLIDTVELLERSSNMRESSIKSSLLYVRPCQALEAQKWFIVLMLSAADSSSEHLHFSSGGPSPPDYTWILEKFR